MKTITLFLGSRCNAHCAYCHAAKKTEGSIDPSVSFYRYLAEEKKSNSALTIRFLGGEPTLYMNTMQEIVDFCKDTNVSYVVTTNGLRLCEETVIDFFNRYNFYVTVSFDGVRGIRGYDDVFYRPDYLPYLKKIKKLGCSMTLSHENADLYQAAGAMREIENEFGRFLPFRPHYVHATTPEVARMSFDHSQACDYVDGYIKLVDKFIRDSQNGLFNPSLYPLFMLLYDSIHKNYIFPETRCFNKNYVQLDLQGSCHLCTYERSEANFLGTADDKSAIFNTLGNIIEQRRPGCIGCEFYKFCGTYCLASVIPERECYIRKRLLTWFLDMLAKQTSDFGYLSEQEFVKRTGGFYELYR